MQKLSANTAIAPGKGRVFLTGAIVLISLPLAAWAVNDLVRAGGGLHELAVHTYRRARSNFNNPSAPADSLTLPKSADEPLNPAETEVTVWVNASADRHPISPYIYGMAFAPQRHLTDLRLGSNRWGGNDKSRYNWAHGNAGNSARDWHWANRPASGKESPAVTTASSAADAFVTASKNAGAAAVLTVPTIGWVARDDNTSNRSVNVPAQGGPAQPGGTGAIAGYDPALNRQRTSVRSAAHKSASPDITVSTVYQDEWISHLKSRFGDAAAGGVKFYAMDNEPDLWDTTHTDIHPSRPGYDELRANFLEYAQAVKAVDPTAQVTGPVVSGWTGYQYSALDRGDDNFRSHADRRQHGDEPFLLWFLKQVRAADTSRGKRTLDVLDVHCYPQGAGLYPGRGDSTDKTRARRIRATRALWDRSYVDESWIAQPVQLLPRLKEWIASGYPGTRIGITEWNWGGDRDISGAIAVAETLGLFGRENVYLANYWAYPPKDSPAYLAFKLYRNADGQGHGFGDQSCQARSAEIQRVSCFAARDTTGDELTLILINKMPQTTASIKARIRGWQNALAKPETLRGEQWQLNAATVGTILAQPVTVPQNAVSTASGETVLSMRLPPYSVTLLRLKSSTPVRESTNRKSAVVPFRRLRNFRESH